MTHEHAARMVGVSVTVVPDGICKDTGRCRISLRVVPTGDPDAPKLVDLTRWPEEVARIAKHIRLSGAHVVNGAQGPEPSNMAFVRGCYGNDVDLKAAEATVLWQNVLADGETSIEIGCERLMSALSGTSPAPQPTHIEHYAEAKLAEWTQGLSDAAFAGTIQHRAMLLSSLTASTDSLTALPSDPSRPSAGAWQEFHDTWFKRKPDDVARDAAKRSAASIGVLNARTFAEAAPHLDTLHGNIAGLDRAIEHIRSLNVDTLFAPRLAGSDEHGEVIRREIENFERYWGIGRKRKALPTDEERTADNTQAAPMRKFAGMLSYPALAKYFRLILDFDVEWPAIQERLRPGMANRFYGLLAADFVEETACPSGGLWPKDAIGVNGPLHWTAVALGAGALGASPYFGPCSRQEALDGDPNKADWFRDGVIDLSTKIQTEHGSDDRFKLVIEDTTTAIYSTKKTAEDVVEARNNGRVQDDQSTRLPARHSSGITLLDSSLLTDTASQSIADKTLRFISFAEDLLEGYRVDVVLLHKDSDASGWRAVERWRTLTARDVRFPNEAQMPPDFAKAVARFRDRDDGRIRTATTNTTYEDDRGQAQTMQVDSRLFSWRGESLGVPMPNGPRKVEKRIRGVVDVDGRLDMAVDITFSVPRKGEAGGDRRPPPLRERRRYMFGMRACLINGCGPTLEEARAQYTARGAKVVLGKTTDEPLTFIRYNEVQAPDVLLHWTDPLVSATDPKVERPGENIDTIVVRSGRSMETPLASRVLVPGRATFDASEQAGKFDEHSGDSRARGAFARDIRIQTCPKNGTFPIARNREWTTTDCDGDGAGNRVLPDANASRATQSTQQSRGSVFVPDSRADRPETGFFPDSLGGLVCARFVNGESAANQFESLAQPVPFWELTGSPSDAAPIKLDLVRARPNEHGATRGWFTARGRTTLDGYRGGDVVAQRLQVSLKPGEDVELELWAHVDPKAGCDVHAVLCDGMTALAASHRHGRTLGLLTAMSSSGARALRKRFDVMARMDDAALNALEEILCLGPIPRLNNRRRVRLVHAVDVPLRSPAFTGLVAVVMNVEPENSKKTDEENRALSTWSHYVNAHEKTPLGDWQSQPNGTTTFFAGSLQVDRLSTISVRAEGTWCEHDPQCLKRDAKGRWKFIARHAAPARLFEITSISRTDEFRNQDVFLAYDDAANTGQKPVRALAHSFPDAKARRVSVSLVGTSRFTDFFPQETRAERETAAQGIGKYERASDHPVEIWVRSTVRPQHPDVDKVLPVFHWERSKPLREHVTWSRDASVRVYLDPATWPSSGEGERIAVTFGPFKEGFQPLDLEAFDRKVGAFGQFVTRWGADPIHLSGKLDDLVPIDAIDCWQSKTERDERKGVDCWQTTSDLSLPYGLEVKVNGWDAIYEHTLPSGSPISVFGENFIKGATVTVNGFPATDVRVENDMMLKATTSATVTVPIHVEVRNPDLTVSIRSMEPSLDEIEGRWYVDLHIDSQGSYYPFVQLGMARYQPHSAPGLELSQPVTVWAQVPARREGCVTFLKDRYILVEHYGVGFYGLSDVTNPKDGDVPLLDLRVMRASEVGHVEATNDGAIAWKPALDERQQVVEAVGCKPIFKDGRVWWQHTLRLPASADATRYGLLIEEVEMLQADPDPVEYPGEIDYTQGVTTTLVRRSPVFSQTIDLGE